MENIEISIKKSGPIKEAKFIQKPLTIFYGSNNTGKKWVMSEMYDVYLTDIRKELVNNVFFIPSERNSLHLFFSELDTHKTLYPKPIKDYIGWLNNAIENKEEVSNIFKEPVNYLQKKILKGTYEIKKREIVFKSYKNGEILSTKNSLLLASDVAKSFFGLWFYLKYQAKENDMLIIDNLEMNLHPKKHLYIARLLGLLVNKGLKVVVSTNSDFVTRELNTLIILDKDKDKKMQRKYKYKTSEILSIEKVGAYLLDDQTIKSSNISKDDGMNATTFDDVINNINDVNNDIYYNLLSN